MRGLPGRVRGRRAGARGRGPGLGRTSRGRQRRPCGTPADGQYETAARVRAARRRCRGRGRRGGDHRQHYQTGAELLPAGGHGSRYGGGAPATPAGTGTACGRRGGKDRRGADGHRPPLEPWPAGPRGALVPAAAGRPGDRAGGASGPRMVLVCRRGHAQARRRVQRGPGNDVVLQRAPLRHCSVRRRVLGHRAHRRRARHGTVALRCHRRRCPSRRHIRLRGRRGSGASGRHAFVHAVLRGTRPAQTDWLMVPAVHFRGIRHHDGFTNIL